MSAATSLELAFAAVAASRPGMNASPEGIAPASEGIAAAGGAADGAVVGAAFVGIAPSRLPTTLPS